MQDGWQDGYFATDRHKAQQVQVFLCVIVRSCFRTQFSTTTIYHTKQNTQTHTSHINLVNVLDVRVLASDLDALLNGTHSLEQRLHIMLNRIVDELVLGLRLDHAAALRAHHLNAALYVDFRIETFAIDLIEYHIDDNERSGSTDARRAMHANRTLNSHAFLIRL